MTTTADFLVELGTEELPPKALKNLGIIKKIRRYYKYRDIFTKCESITIHGARNDQNK